MTTQELKKYMESVFDMELNIYVQQSTLNRMNNTYASLGKKKVIRQPVKQKASVDIPFYMSAVGVVIGIIAGIIGAIYEYIETPGPIARVLEAIIIFVLYGVIGFIIGGLTVGTIIGLIAKNSKQKELDSDYNKRVKNYNLNVTDDDRRVRNELAQKSRLRSEIQMMSARLLESKNNLRRMYSYGILNPDYQNIYAVSSIYEYLVKGRTNSLTFNENTGDQGAYNIYEYERRMNIIITNTEEILNRLDEIASNQYQLASGLRDANDRINSLCSGVNSFMKSTTASLNSIEHSQSLMAYNTERTNRELAFLTWMQILD